MSKIRISVFKQPDTRQKCQHGFSNTFGRLTVESIQQYRREKSGGEI